MTERPADYHARLMRNLDEPERDWLIDQAGAKVIDLRLHFEREQLLRHCVIVEVDCSEEYE